ncbi:hypothetical protein H4S07_005593, partial [Coemansia furcata]
MSFVISDSEGEECRQAPPPKFRPRVVNRPTPVRARHASSGDKGKEAASRAKALHLSDSDDDGGGDDDDDDDSGSDDTSFFRMARPSLGQTSAIDADDSDGSERESPDAAAGTQQAAASPFHESILECSDSDSQDDSVSNSPRQHHGIAEKRKHSDGSDQADHSRPR